MSGGRWAMRMLAALLLMPAAATSATRVLHYDCRSSSRLHRLALGGPYDFTVTARVDLPAAVRVGAAIAVGTVQLDLDLPEALVTRLRADLQQEKVGGSADARIVVNGRIVAISDLLVSPTRLPASGGLRLTTSGTVAPQIATAPGSLRIEMPADFTLRSIIEPGVWGTVRRSPMDCTAHASAERLLGSIAVVP